MSSSQLAQLLISLWRANHQFNAECRCNFHSIKYVRRVNIGIRVHAFQGKFSDENICIRTIRIKAMSAVSYISSTIPYICMCLCDYSTEFRSDFYWIVAWEWQLDCCSVHRCAVHWYFNLLYILLWKVFHVELYFCLGFVYILYLHIISKTIEFQFKTSYILSFTLIYPIWFSLSKTFHVSHRCFSRFWASVHCEWWPCVVSMRCDR